MRVAATQIARGQYGLDTGIVEHGECCQPYFAKQTLRSTTGKVKYRFAVLINHYRVTQYRDVRGIFDTKDGSHWFGRQVFFGRQFAINKVYNLLHRPNIARSCWRWRVALPEQLWNFSKCGVGGALSGKAPVNHNFAGDINSCRVAHVEERHRRRCTYFSFTLTLLCQYAAHMYTDITKVDINRTRRQTAMTHGAMIGDIVHLLKVSDRDTAPGLFFV